jgi:transposase
VTSGDGLVHGFRVAYIHSSEEEASVQEARERALQNAEEALGRVAHGLGGRYYKTKAQVDARVAQVLSDKLAGLVEVTTGEQEGKPNEEAVAAAGALDGLYGLATNLADPGGRRLTALDVLKIYKDQWVDEQRHRDLKQTLRVRPVFLHNDARIEGLVAVVGIALLIFGLVEAELRAALGDGAPLPGILPEGRAAKPTARAVLAAFDGLEVTYTKNGLVLDHLSNVQRLILALLGIALPWPERAEE